MIQSIDQGIISTFKINYVKWNFNDIFNKPEDNESPVEAWNKHAVLNCIKNIALASSDTNPLNACWKTTWPEAVVPGNMVPTTEEGVTGISNLLNKFQEGGLRTYTF